MESPPPPEPAKNDQQQAAPTNSTTGISPRRGKADGEEKRAKIKRSPVARPTNVPTPAEPTLHQSTPHRDSSSLHTDLLPSVCLLPGPPRG
jgi:hypothetical protein